jgi:hypothetical protein
MVRIARIYPEKGFAGLMSAVRSEPSLPECLGLLLMAFGIQVFEYTSHGGFWRWVLAFADNPEFLPAAEFIKQWRFGASYPDWHFAGLPIAIAALSTVFRISTPVTLVLLSVLCSTSACIVIYRLYGGAVTAAFLIVSAEWLQGSLLGANEPLFTLLFLASFLAVRSGFWSSAALLSSLATTVRPVGVFVVLALGIDLLRRRKWADLAWSVTIAGGIGCAYLWFAHMLTGDAFMNFKRYRFDWGESGSPLAMPPVALLRSLRSILSESRWYVSMKYLGWPILTMLLIAALCANREARTQVWRVHAVESIAVSLYIFFFLSYNYSGVGWYWPRFMIPVIPFLLLSIRKWLPSTIWIVWPAVALSSLLACSELLKMKTVFGFAFHR